MTHKSIAAVLAFLALVAGCQSAADVPATQQAIVQEGNGGPEVLALKSVPVLDPGPGQVLIEVHAAAVNPIDWKVREGYSGPSKPLGTVPPGEPPARIPGFDAAGVVVKVGAGVSSLNVGDKVFTMIGRLKVDGLNGSYAHFIIAGEDNVAPKPESLSFAEAAGMATVGITAARELWDVDIEPGTRVFIDGIAGGVGSSAAQIAKAKGAVVIGTASARHHEYLDSLGVDQVVDYTKVEFTEVVEPVDIYLETVSAGLAAKGLAIIKPGGRLVSVVGGPAAELCEQANVTCPTPGPPGPDGPSEAERLHYIADLANQGKFSVNIDKAFPLEEAAAAQEYNREGHTQGKVVLIVIPEE